MSNSGLVCYRCKAGFHTAAGLAAHPCATRTTMAPHCALCQRERVMSPWLLLCPVCDAPRCGRDMPLLLVLPSALLWFEGDEVTVIDALDEP